LRDAGVTGRERRTVVARTAATVILQAWLDATR
jgi:RNase H-fold protein (predicted Holliday junction resolvase)